MTVSIEGTAAVRAAAAILDIMNLFLQLAAG